MVAKANRRGSRRLRTTLVAREVDYSFNFHIGHNVRHPYSFNCSSQHEQSDLNRYVGSVERLGGWCFGDSFTL